MTAVRPTKSALAGVALACLSTSLGGMTVALTRLVIAETDPLSLTFVRYGIGGLVLLAVILSIWSPPRFAIRDLPALVVLGLVMFAAFPFFMARALADTTSAHGGLIFATMPMTTMIIAAIFRIERMTVLKTIGVFMTIIGAWLALGEDVGAIAPNALRGDLFMFAGITSASCFNVFSQKFLYRYGSLPVIMLTMLIGAAGLFFLAIMFGQPFTGSLDFDLVGWAIVLVLGIPGAALMVGAWGFALRAITPTQATIAIGFNPLTAILLGAWLLGEPITARVLLAFGLIFAAILVANLGPRRRIRVSALS